jgi:hypothetical protein
MLPQFVEFERHSLTATIDVSWGTASSAKNGKSAARHALTSVLSLQTALLESPLSGRRRATYHRFSTDWLNTSQKKSSRVKQVVTASMKTRRERGFDWSFLAAEVNEKFVTGRSEVACSAKYLRSFTEARY